MTTCVDDWFPSYVPGPPARSTPVDIVVTSVPVLTTLVMWTIFECNGKASTSPFTPNLLSLTRLVALVSTAAQCFLVHRIFDILECESAFPHPARWKALPVIAIVATNALCVFALAHRAPRICASVALLFAVACVAGEYALRDLFPTSAVQCLVPIQQFYCVILVTFLTVPRRGLPSTNPRPTPALRVVDPLQRRRDQEDEKPPSWWA